MLKTFFLFLFCLSVQAHNVVYFSIIEGVTDEHGVYTRILKEAYKRAGLHPRFIFVPPKRSQVLMAKGNEDCEVPGNVGIEPEKLIYSSAINHAKLMVFYKKGGTPLKNLEDLQGKRLVSRRGWPMGEKVKDLAYEKIEVRTERQQYDLLFVENRKIDGALAFIPDFFSVLTEKERSKIDYNPKFVLHLLKDRIACIKSKINQKHLDKISRILKEMHKSGYIRKILGKHYVPAD